MKAEHFNPFIIATNNIFETVVGVKLERGKIGLISKPPGNSEVIITLGITGELRGQAYLRLTGDTSKDIASRMMMGMDVPMLDDLATSALKELGNMIMGTSAQLLERGGVVVDITPPTLFTGTDIFVTYPSKNTLTIPLHASGLSFDLDVSIQD